MGPTMALKRAHARASLPEPSIATEPGWTEKVKPGWMGTFAPSREMDCGGGHTGEAADGKGAAGKAEGGTEPDDAITAAAAVESTCTKTVV